MFLCYSGVFNGNGLRDSGAIGVVEEKTVLLVTSNLKLRKEPSAKSPQVSCSAMDGGCPGGDCGGTISFVNAGVVIKSPRRTAAREKNSGASGYWYQLGGECQAWVFGGFTEELYNENKPVSNYTLSAIQPPVYPGEAITKCAKLKMKLASMAQLMDAKKTGKIQTSDPATQSVWYLQKKGEYDILDLESGNTLTSVGPETLIPFYCVK